MVTERIWDQFCEELIMANRSQNRCTVLSAFLKEAIEFNQHLNETSGASGKSKIYLYYSEITPTQNLLDYFGLRLMYIDPSSAPELNTYLYQVVRK